MDIIGQIASLGGPGWLLFAGSLLVIGVMYKDAKEKETKHSQDLLDVTKQSISTQRDNLNASVSLQKSVDRVIDILDTIRKI